MNPTNKFLIITGIVALLIVLVGVLLYIIPDDPNDTPQEADLELGEEVLEEEALQGDELERLGNELASLLNQKLGTGMGIRELTLVESLELGVGDNSDKYIVRNSNVYSSGEIMIYYVIENIEPVKGATGKSNVHVLNKIELIDPNGDPVKWFNNKYSFELNKEANTENVQQLPFSIREAVNKFEKKGLYTLYIDVVNKALNQRAKEKIEFVIE